MFSKYVVTGAFLGVTGGGNYWLNAPRDQSHLGLDLMLNKLDTISKSTLETTGSWDAARTLNHLAQSVEFSMSGFPQEKSAIFQNTVGKLAYKVFNARGEMTHGLDEPIPGEIISEEVETKEALNRLKTSLLYFKAYQSNLKPHFAYGSLDKDEYAIAHVLHINNHLEEFRLV